MSQTPILNPHASGLFCLAGVRSVERVSVNKTCSCSSVTTIFPASAAPVRPFP